MAEVAMPSGRKGNVPIRIPRSFQPRPVYLGEIRRHLILFESSCGTSCLSASKMVGVGGNCWIFSCGGEGRDHLTPF